MIDHRQARFKNRLVIWPDHTAPQHDLGIWPAALDMLQIAELADDPCLGRRAHTARIEHDKGRILGPIRRRVPNALQRRFEPIRVGHIHLAADRPNIVASLARRRIARWARQARVQFFF